MDQRSAVGSVTANHVKSFCEKLNSLDQLFSDTLWCPNSQNKRLNSPRLRHGSVQMNDASLQLITKYDILVTARV